MYTTLLHRVPEDIKKQVRSIENVSNKIIKRRSSIVYNNVCLNENLWPIYTNFRNHDQALRNHSETINNNSI